MQPLEQSVAALILGLPCEDTEQTAALLRGLPGRGGYDGKLAQWLERQREVLPESVAIEEFDSPHDRGVDLLVSGLDSGCRIGFQIKSDGDLAAKDFTPKLKAQILDSQSLGVGLMIVVFACRPTRNNKNKVRYWQSYCAQHGPSLMCVAPERAAAVLREGASPILPKPGKKSWADLFLALGQISLAPAYLDSWPGLDPDQRFLPPAELAQVQAALSRHRLVFVVGPPAVGKTFTALQLLWLAYNEGRPVKWVTASGTEPTDGPVVDLACDPNERAAFGRRVEWLLSALAPAGRRQPVDEHDVITRLLEPGALVYVEDPFGRTDETYELSLASYDFFDLSRLVELLDASARRASCQILVRVCHVITDSVDGAGSGWMV